MRAALYWVPSLDDPLYAAGVAWLGRDAETGAPVPQPPIAGIATLTQDARRYGFHATLRPPMRLATGYQEFRAASRKIAACVAPFALPALQLTDIGGFLALRETTPCSGLQDLADRCVLDTEPHRLPPDAAELARRHEAGLTARQAMLLDRFGYPYVMAEWFFHITLTARLDEPTMARMREAAEAHFAPVLALSRTVRDVCICTQGGGDFLIAERLGFGEEK